VALEREFSLEIEAAWRWQNRVITTNAISPGMVRDKVGLLLRASQRVGRGHVKLGEAALVKSKELPIMGVLSVKPGEAVDADPLRMAMLVAIGMLDPEPAAQAEGAELRFG
jgi:hypothetical protein